MATPQLVKQLKPCIEQLEDLLASSESFGAFATSLNGCVEILQELLRLSSSLPAGKILRSMPYPNADRIFKNTIWVVNDAVRLQANITALEGSCSPNRTLEKFLPEPETRVKDSSHVTLFNPKQNLLSERHLAHRLLTTLNLMKDMHKLLVFFKSSFFGSEVLDSTGKFSQVSLVLKETVSMTEATAQTQTSEDCDLARICHTLNKPVLIAMNALCLLFEFLVVDHVKYGSDLGLCQSAVHIFVNAVGILNDLTQFFSEGYSNLKVSGDKLAQSKDVIVKYCAEIFSPKTNNVTDFQSMWSDDFLVQLSKNICDVIIPQSLQDIKCNDVGTLMELSENTNDVNVTQNVCKGDTSTNLQSISAFMCSYQVTSNKNMNDVSIVQNSCSIKFSNVDTSAALQSMLVRTNSFQDTKKQDFQGTRVTKPKERFVLDEFTEYFKGSCALAGNPVTVKNAACKSKKLSGCSEHADNLRKTCVEGTGAQDEVSTDDSTEWHSILTERVEDWYAIALKTSADLAAPAHFFCDSVEANFVFLNNGQKHRVAELVEEFKDAMNFFSIKENSARLQFFCHACRRYVASKKVRDHVVNEQHLRKLRVEAKRVAQRCPEQSSNSYENVPEPKKRHPLNVFCHYFKDFSATAGNSAHKPDDVDTIRAKYSDDSCKLVSESQKRRFSLSENLVECSDTKISKITNIKFSSWRMKREVPVWSDDDA